MAFDSESKTIKYWVHQGTNYATQCLNGKLFFVSLHGETFFLLKTPHIFIIAKFSIRKSTRYSSLLNIFDVLHNPV